MTITNPSPSKRMKSEHTFCCGSYPRKKVKQPVGKLPDNPVVTGGRALVYLGAGYARFKSTRKGVYYYVSDQRRHFWVWPEDLEQLLQAATLMLKP